MTRNAKYYSGKILRYFFQGLVIIAPMAVTIYVIYILFINIDDILPFPNMPRGIGFVIILLTITVIGYLASTLIIGQFLFRFFDTILERTPFIKLIYSSVKDIMQSFVGDNRKFDKPVLVMIRNNPEIWQVGFMMHNDLEKIGLQDKLAVYVPHSYAISGNLYIVDTENVKRLEGMSTVEAMKFAVSGGAVNFEEDDHHKKKIFK